MWDLWERQWTESHSTTKRKQCWITGSVHILLLSAINWDYFNEKVMVFHIFELKIKSICSYSQSHTTQTEPNYSSLNLSQTEPFWLIKIFSSFTTKQINIHSPLVIHMCLRDAKKHLLLDRKTKSQHR